MIVNNELEGVWKEAVLASFKILFQGLPGRTEENNEKHSQDNQIPRRGTKRVPLKHKPDVST
jgi:hypothetical protein